MSTIDATSTSASSLEKYVALFSSRNRRHVVDNGVVWFVANGVVYPWGPAKRKYSLDKEAKKRVFRALGSPLILMTGGFQTGLETEWYAVICDRFVGIEDMRSRNTRSKVRRAIKNCDVRRVDAAHVAENAYETMAAAYKHYGDFASNLPDEDQWRQKMLRNELFADFIDYWAVFHDEKLIAVAENYLLDDVEVNYSAITFHPEFLHLYSSYALIHKMNEFYLGKGFEYVNDGWRCIRHETEIQEYLIHNFGFRKAYTDLHVEYRPALGLAVRLSYPFRRVLGKLDSRLRTLYELERIQRSSLRSDSH